ncbi:hypothetical protein [Prevotella sp. tf2-5]|uniref:hypothetical protein n=1 Tax=Prevotella sp. tf2-5 TaxID=1761889 RepID=UPI0008EA236B|nr:hypothetical protein [Prevotella sp. tf2-5]SFO53228.1 hypothetical protein SAMN04487852_102197 [Prevotella sp. tf2-5]
MTSVQNSRLEWIDWMKTLGIYALVLGHFYSVGEKFVYVFHVLSFFVISVFCKKGKTTYCFGRSFGIIERF